MIRMKNDVKSLGEHSAPGDLLMLKTSQTSSNL